MNDVAIPASLVKELREKTGAGMMECKNALKMSHGKIDDAIDYLRKSGMLKAGKKADRIAAEGVIAMKENNHAALMMEVNSETDFVARDSNFTQFVEDVANAALENKVQDLTQLSNVTLANGQSVDEARQHLIAKIGENVQVRRLVCSNDAAKSVGTYLHGTRIGVIVELDTDNKALAKDIAMHIAASKPIVISPENVSQDLIAKEKEIYKAQAETSGKPAEIIEKMVAGRVKKYLDEISLTGQPFVKDPNLSVGQLLAKENAKVLNFHRFEVGEGIEKVTEDFKEAVMSQIQK